MKLGFRSFKLTVAYTTLSTGPPPST